MFMTALSSDWWGSTLRSAFAGETRYVGLPLVDFLEIRIEVIEATLPLLAEWLQPCVDAFEGATDD
jgi:hypothetical protein